jgi:uncharacterized membrane protein
MHLNEIAMSITSDIAIVVEVGAALLIAAGAGQALVGMFRASLHAHPGTHGERREIWLRFASWLVLALEFTLAADVARTATAPTWTGIGQLAAIAAIRTGLNYFLTRDIHEFSEAPREFSEAPRGLSEAPRD